MITTEDRVDCLLCASRGEPLYRETRDRSFDAPGEWSHLRCPACGLVWLNPQPDATSVAALYASYFTHEDRPPDSAFKRAVKRGIPAARDGYEDRVDDAAERRLGRWLAHVGPLREIAAQSTLGLPAARRGRLLDVGCGAGELLGHMQSLGWEVVGAEPDPAAREVVRRSLGVHVVEDVVGDELEADSFDAVTLNHVIEHLRNPLQTLRACRRVLRPGGWLALATPNARSLGHRRFGADWLHLDPPRHLTLFHAGTLRELVARAGFDIVECRTSSASAYFVWLASSLLQQRGCLQGVDVGVASLSTRIAGLSFWAIEYARARAGEACGEEVLLIAERPMGGSP